MPWIDKKFCCGSVEVTTRHFKCGWCGMLMTLDPQEGVPFGWVETNEPIVDYFCSRRCRHDYMTLEGN